MAVGQMMAPSVATASPSPCSNTPLANSLMNSSSTVHMVMRLPSDGNRRSGWLRTLCCLRPGPWPSGCGSRVLRTRRARWYGYTATRFPGWVIRPLGRSSHWYSSVSTVAMLGGATMRRPSSRTITLAGNRPAAFDYTRLNFSNVPFTNGWASTPRCPSSRSE